MATLKNSDKQQKIIAVQKQADDNILVIVETVITSTFVLNSTEWSKLDANGKRKADKAGALAKVKAAAKAAKL